jgi:hypothetical protein
MRTPLAAIPLVMSVAIAAAAPRQTTAMVGDVRLDLATVARPPRLPRRSERRDRPLAGMPSLWFGARPITALPRRHPGRSRPNVRGPSSLHAGLGLDVVHARIRPDEDRAGASVFLDARALASRGPVMFQAIVRGTRYFDLDCAPSLLPERLCGTFDTFDFAPRYGSDSEVRVGYRKSGIYVGLRHLAIWVRDRVEHGNLVTAGIVAW